MSNVSNYLIVFCLLFSGVVTAQKSESDRLKKEQQDLKNKISFTEKLIETTRSNKENLSSNIVLYDRKIEYRSDLLNNLNMQLRQLALEIDQIKVEIESLQLEIERQKNAYRIMLKHTYKMRNSSASLLFILSAESFNQASKRMAYLKQLSKFRSDQIVKIENSKQALETNLTDLEQKKTEKDELMSNQSQEQKQYISDREYQKRQIENLKGKENELLKELNKQMEESRKLQSALNAALNKEALDKKKREDEKGGLTAEEKEKVALSNLGFETDKGKLPWPVSKGEITKGYGKQAHPVHINVYTYNNGIDISTVKGSAVKAVYDGEVTSVVVIPGAGKAIMIGHGDYRSVYSNLQEVYVSKGDKVKTGQDIGYLLVNGSGNSEVHFEICKITPEGDIVHVNPTYWLSH